MNKEEAKLASEKLDQLLEKWREDEISDIEFCEFAIPHISMISTYFEKEETPAAAESKRTMYEDLEKDLDLEDGDPPVFEPESQQQEDLFSKEESEDLEEEKDDESKSKSKKRKEFAGSDGEIPF